MSCAGLLGGAVYVNAFTLISRHVDPLMREFSLAAASLGDSLGIAFADVAGVLVQVSAYSLTAVMNSNPLWFLDWKEACEGFALPVCFGLKSVLHYLKAGYAAYEPQSVHPWLQCAVKFISLNILLTVLTMLAQTVKVSNALLTQHKLQTRDTFKLVLLYGISRYLSIEVDCGVESVVFQGCSVSHAAKEGRCAVCRAAYTRQTGYQVPAFHVKLCSAL